MRNSETAGFAAEAAIKLRSLLASQSRCCDRLEHIADSLPETADPQECLYLAQGVLSVVKQAHDFEERVLFPYLLESQPLQKDLAATLERLRYEHLGDEDFANDLALALRQFVTERDACNVESLAWMLRGFFEGLRRHVAFEREHVLPLVESAAHP